MPSIRIGVHTSIAAVRETWDRIAPRGEVVLESAHLEAIARSGVNDIEPYYLIAYDGERPAGIAYCFLMRLDLASLEKDISPEALVALRSWDPGFMHVRILECGIVSGLGRAMAVVRPADLGVVCRAFAAEMGRLAREAEAEFVLVRDIPHGMLAEHEGFVQEGYAPLLGFPIATMPVKWKSFDEYLHALKSTTRYRMRHDSSHSLPGLEVEVVKDFGRHAQQMADLWRQTNSRASDYSHERLTAAYFLEIDRCLGERSHAILLKRNGRIVAFGLTLLGDDEYVPLHCGVDYSEGDGEKLYRRLCLETLQDALDRQPRSINWGITTYDFKFARGFEAEPIVYFVKHVARPQLTLALARGLQSSIKQPENSHRPFSRQETTTRVDLKALAPRLPVVTPPPPSEDVFSKVFGYDRPSSLKVAGIYSFFPPFESAQGPTVRYEGRDVVMLGSNAYLGLGTHPKVAAAAKAAIDEYGAGCSGSPLLNGTLDLHLALARSLAAFMGKEDAILCSTGYQTNLGVVSALLAKDDVVILDQFDHASLVDGARLAGAQIARFRHNDMGSLEEMLRAHPQRGKLIAVDSVFSMEGTVADLPTIVALARKYGARTMVDEAHAIGVLGPGGRGAAELLGVLEDVDIVMGTFSKSLASIGGFVAGERRVIDYLRHVARSHMFSASLPPSAVAAVGAALDIIESEPERRRKLLGNAAYMARGLQALGYDAEYHQTAIVPVHCGSDAMALGAYKRLLDQGVFVNPVLYPAVPKGRELLRTSYMATHTREMLDRALEVFARARTPSYPKPTATRSRGARATEPALRVRPLVLLPVADRRSLARFYLVASQQTVLRVPGFIRLDLGQPIDCGISLGQEGVKLQYPGVVSSKCLVPHPGRPLGIEVELLQSPDGTRELFERILAGGAMPPVGRHCWRYHADMGVEWALDAEPCLDTLEDISLDGASIKSQRDPEIGSRLPLRLRAAPGVPIEVAGEVRWRRQGARPAFGVCFRFSDEQERDRVRVLVERIKAASFEPAVVSAVIH